MTLQELRDILRANIFDEAATFLSDNQANRYINLAMQHVANLVESFQAHILFWVTPEDILLENESAKQIVISPNPTDVRRVIGVDRVDGGGDLGDDPSLKIISFEAAVHERKDALLERPPAFTIQTYVGFVSPPKLEFKFRLYYIKALTDLTDEPGSNTVELLPAHHQILIPAYATVLALSAENADTTQWRQNVNEMAVAAGLAIAERGEQPQEVRE